MMRRHELMIALVLKVLLLRRSVRLNRWQMQGKRQPESGKRLTDCEELEESARASKLRRLLLKSTKDREASGRNAHRRR